MGLGHLLAGLNAVTGYEFSMADFLVSGQRAWVLKRGLNNLMGVTAADDRLPKKIRIPLTDGGAAGSVPDEELMRNEYYRIRGLDDQGLPTVQLLQSLGLEFLSDNFS
jgi:aldehyde:ferredoxin oxidoreductase